MVFLSEMHSLGDIGLGWVGLGWVRKVILEKGGVGAKPPPKRWGGGAKPPSLGNFCG